MSDNVNKIVESVEKLTVLELAELVMFLAFGIKKSSVARRNRIPVN